jgi:hypothetical protein
MHTKLLLLLLPCILLCCQPEGEYPEASKEWIVISDGHEQRYNKGSVLRTIGDALEIFEPGYTRSAVFSLKTKEDTLYIGTDTFLYAKAPQEWAFRHPGSKDTIRAIALRVTGNILTDSMLIGRTLLEQRQLPHGEVYLSPTVIEQYTDQLYFKVRCFGEGAAENDIRMQNSQEGWSVCRRFNQPIVQFWQMGFGLITLVDSVKDQRIFGRQFPTDDSDVYWDSERLIAPKVIYSKVENGRFFQLINEGKLRYQFKQFQLPDYLEDLEDIEDEIEMAPAAPEKLEVSPISQELQEELNKNGKNDERYTLRLRNEEMANRAYFLPEDLAQLGLNFEPNHRFSIFSGDRIIRKGLYKMSADKRWLELNGGCEATAYWHIDQFEPDHLNLSAFIEIAISADQYHTNLMGLVVAFDFSLEDQAGPQVQGKGIK